MKDCLPPEVLKELSERRFRGQGLVEILKHLETCEKCRSKIRPPTKEEILKRFKDDDLPPSSSNSVSSRKKKES